MNKQIYFKKNGQSAWREYGPVRDINSFNRDFADWVARYYEGCEQQYCQSWDDAEEVLATVGSSAEAGQFKIANWPEAK